MSLYVAGQKLRASDLNALLPLYARYERTSGTQPAATSTDTQLQFPVATATHADVVASGTSNNAFTLAAPTGYDVVWTVTCSLSLSAAAVSAELSLATGSTTWAAANGKAANGSSSVRVETVLLVPVAAGTTVAVTASLWQASGGTINITGTTFPSQISFKR